MNYFDVDYYTLVSLGRLGTTTAETLLLESARELGWVSCVDNLAASLAALEADDYVTVLHDERILRADTSVSLTGTGIEAIRVGGMAKLFSGMRDKAIRKNEEAFCALARPVAEPFSIDRASFAACEEQSEHDAESSFFTVQNAEDGLFELSMGRIYADEETDADGDSVANDGLSLLVDLDTYLRATNDLLDTALYFTETHRARKILLSSNGKAYVISFCEVADDGDYPYLRVTAAPVLFNRQRFVGKRDSDLDYAQCGANVLTTSLGAPDDLCGMILYAVSRRIDLLDESLGQKLHTLYRKIR